MNDTIKSWIAIGSSAIAIFVSIITLYLANFNEVSLKTVKSESVYICNAIGGLPRVKTSIGLYAKGSSNKTLAIISAKMTLQRELSTKKDNPIELVPDDTMGLYSSFLDNKNISQLPLILKGGDLQSINILFSFDNTSDRVSRIENWGKKLISEFLDPQKESLIMSHIEYEKNTYYNKKFINKNGIIEGAMHEIFQLQGLPVPLNPDTTTIEDIVIEIGAEKNREYNYFVSGKYVGNITLVLTNGDNIDIPFVFSVDGNEEIRLKNRYNTWMRKNIAG